MNHLYWANCLVIKDPVFKTRNLNIVIRDDGNMASWILLIHDQSVSNIRMFSKVLRKYGKWKILFFTLVFRCTLFLNRILLILLAKF